MARVDCLYCGRQFKAKKGEHVVPDSLGCSKRIRRVCTKCNNEILSTLDKELVRKSPLSFAVFTALEDPPEYVWDIDSADGSLLESCPMPGFTGNRIYPQLHLSRDIWLLRCDEEEILEIGREYFHKYFFNLARAAARNFKAESGRRPKITPERVYPPDQSFYPPRLFSRRRPPEFHDRMSFILRYSDKVDAARLIDRLIYPRQAKNSFQQNRLVGSPVGTFQASFNPVTVIRALVKIGLNLLEYTCRKTPISRETFPEATRFVLGKSEMVGLERNGFAEPRGFESIKGRPEYHTFYLKHLAPRKEWLVYSSFFGGLACTKATVPGPNNEDWDSVLVTATTDNTDWTIQPLRLELPIRLKRCDFEMTRSVPTVPALTSARRVRFS